MNTLLKIRENFYWLPSSLMIVSAIAKFSGITLVIESLGKLGLHDKIILLGILEIGCLTIFLIPRTMLIGFFLLCSYWGGAITADLIGGVFNPVPVIMLILFWIALYFKIPSLFLNHFSFKR